MSTPSQRSCLFVIPFTAENLQAGTVFYAIYFWVSFPMFIEMDEDPKAAPWSLSYTVTNAMAAGMICTILLDAWRLLIGPIFKGAAAAGGRGGYGGLPWL
jgi:cycloeucalenol cycloisomerase